MSRTGSVVLAALLPLTHADTSYFGGNFKLVLLGGLVATLVVLSIIVHRQRQKLVRRFRDIDEQGELKGVTGFGEFDAEIIATARGQLRNDWRWRLGWLPLALLLTFGLPALYQILAGYPLRADAPFTFVHLALMTCGTLAYLAIRTWAIDHYHCQICHQRIGPLDAPTLVFHCGRCDVLWSTGDVSGYRLWRNR